MKERIIKNTLAILVFTVFSYTIINAQHSEFYGFSTNGIFKTDSNGNNLQIVYDFPYSLEGVNPGSSLCMASNGKFYGITQGGGIDGDGVIFEWDPVTNTYRKKLDLHSAESGSGQFSSLVQAGNGKFYGMTSMGGMNNMGVLFEWDLVTNSLIKKLDFIGTENGSFPEGSLMLADNGKIYGMTTYGGIDNYGVLFEWDPATDTYAKKIDFNGVENGSNPKGSLLQADNGKLYGMTWAGGTNDGGVLFEWDPFTNDYIKKYDFNEENGDHPKGSLIKAGNGKFYGVANGGAFGYGVLFEWEKEINTYTKKFDFTGSETGASPESLVGADNGKLYGITADGLNDVLFDWDPSSGTFSRKTSFYGEEKGNLPFGSLVLAGNGKLYGMTHEGGITDCGIIYEWDPENDAFTKKFDFKKADNGLEPVGVPVMADNRKLYGLTRLGGDYNDGVLFEWDPVTYAFSRKFSFNGKGSGKEPYGSLLKAGNGILYGMTNSGGTYDCGVLFEWDPSNNTFLKKLDLVKIRPSLNSFGSLMQADNGKLYGTLNEGGALAQGVLFEWDPVTGIYRRKLDFNGVEYGSNPHGPLVEANNGKLYGTNSSGGSNNIGVLFEYDPVTNIFMKKLDFTGADNGSRPWGSLLQARNGKLYGTTYEGGLNNYGVLFEWDPVNDGYTKKIDFRNVENGVYPRGSLMQAGNGKIYGRMALKQWDDLGSLFEWDPVTGILIRKPETTVEEVRFQDGLSEITYPAFDMVNAEACNIYISPSGKFIWDNSGVYKDTVPGPSGYKTILTINLTINHSTENTISPVANYRYISPGGKTLTNSGEYKDTIPNTAGCDSIITINLTIVPSDTSSTQEFYGMTYTGGEYNQGTIYKTDENGNNVNVVYNFPVKNEGMRPVGKLCNASNGKYYGMTYEGGLGYGILYEWDPETNIYISRFSFDSLKYGRYPKGSLVQAANGKLYGMTSGGGETGNGVLFEWDPASGSYTKKLDFKTKEVTYSSQLVRAVNGKLYGMTAAGGANGDGMIFEWEPESGTYINKFDFDESINGKAPFGSLMYESNGNLYGMTLLGGLNGSGVIFEWNPATQQFIKRCDFVNGYPHPDKALVLADNGKFYGMNEDRIFEWDTATNAFSQKYILANPQDGSYFSSNLLQAFNGKLYGMTASGGNANCGVLFEWDPATNAYTRKFDFNGNDGSSALSLIQLSNGKLIGITSNGGTDNSGVCFEWDIASETYTMKFNFNNCENGRNPIGSLVQVCNDLLYGTTFAGGKYGQGVLFEWDISTHTFTKKADFNGTETGNHPKGSMVLAGNGKLIGLTDYTQDGPPVIFEWNPVTGILSKEFNFPEIEYSQFGSLTKAKNGKIYGTTGGLNGECEIFEWDPVANNYLTKFEGGCSRFTLTQANNEKFYGISGGGMTGIGGIFEWDPNTNTLYKKCNYIPGNQYYTYLCSSLIQADNGKFYGRTSDAEFIEGNIYEWDTTFNFATDRIGNSDLKVGRDFDSPMLLADNGKLYGTSSNGGKYDKGTLFEYNPVTNIFVTKNYFNGTNGSIPLGGLIEIEHTPATVLNVQTCNSFTSPSGNYTWSTSGVYKDTLRCDAGYDSIITINLTIMAADATVTQNQSVLSANAAGAAYQWINCIDGNIPLDGENHQTFIAPANGNYAVIVSQNGCIDTSACFTVSATGLIVNTFKHNIIFYPNPTDGSFTIDLGSIYRKAEITLTQPDGRVIRKDYIINSRFKDLQISESPGPYVVTVTADKQKAVFKILKK